MINKFLVRKNSYYDSVTLMIITREIESAAEVENGVVVMGTEHNKMLIENIGLINDEIKAATPNDLIIALRLREESTFEAVVERIEGLLNKRKSDGEEEYCPPTFESALKHMPDSNMVIISLPGKYAASEARKALLNGKHVLLFSDNVTIQEEKELKELAVERGLLMMGPDCGTAIINNVPLAFANVVKSGPIGIVGASGTGTQEVMVQIDRFGGGVSQVIGTGGRDLRSEIGGLMMLQGIDALAGDKDTKIIVLISKPPAPEIAEKVLKALKSCGKKAVVDFIGGDEELVRSYGFIPASTLEEAAYKAVLLAKGKEIKDAPEFTLDMDEIDIIAAGEVSRFSKGQKYLRGLYSGGTLCDETLKILTREFGGIYSNIPLTSEYKLMEKEKGYKHSAVDLGDDEFTVGRPHPMIDSYTRQQMILREAEDDEVAVLILDVVLGYGSNDDPAGTLTDYIKRAKAKFEERGQYLCVIASICGTPQDPQNYEGQEKKLRDAGVILMPSNAQAARLCVKIIRGIGKEVVGCQR